MLNKTNYLTWIIAIVCVYGNGSWLYYENNQIFSLLLVVVFLILVIREKHYGALVKPRFTSGIIILYPIFATLFKYSDLSNPISLISSSILTLAISVLSLQRIIEILDKYCTIILFLVILSIPLYILFVFFERVNVLPVSSTIFADYYNLYIYTHRVWGGRSQGIFWEPGAWAVNQIFSFFWFMFYKKNYKLYPVFFVSLILTASTTGFLLLILITVNLAFKYIRENGFDLKVISIIFFSLNAIVFALSYLDADSLQLLNIFDKLDPSSNSFGSFEERMATSVDALNIANNSILFGMGKTSYLYVTSTVFDVLYQFGYLYAFLYILFFWQIFRGLNPILSLPFALIMLNGEVMSYYSLYVLLIVAGSRLIFFKTPDELIKKLVTSKFAQKNSSHTQKKTLTA